MHVIPALTDEIEIQAGATVSKVLVKDGPVRVVLFAFDAGEELTEHTAALPVVIQVVSGSITVTASGAEHRLTADGWLWLEANEPHTVVADEPARMLLTMIRGS
jgi:quercetin dioxygenase-like cupin family protein